METRELPSRWSGYARRLPSSLKDLSGPATGTVVLPLQVAGSGRRAYDISDERQRLMLYALLLAGGYAFRAREILYRPSQDLDFATGNHEPLPDIAEHDLARRLASEHMDDETPDDS